MVEGSPYMNSRKTAVNLYLHLIPYPDKNKHIESYKVFKTLINKNTLVGLVQKNNRN